MPKSLIAAIGSKNSAALAQNQRLLGEEHLGLGGGQTGYGGAGSISSNQYLEKVHHYWDYLSRQLPQLETVKFVNFHK